MKEPTDDFIYSSPTRTLELADSVMEARDIPRSEDTIRMPAYHLWNLKRHGWSDDNILSNAPHYHSNLVEALKSL